MVLHACQLALGCNAEEAAEREPSTAPASDDPVEEREQSRGPFKENSFAKPQQTAVSLKYLGCLTLAVDKGKMSPHSPRFVPLGIDQFSPLSTPQGVPLPRS